MVQELNDSFPQIRENPNCVFPSPEDGEAAGINPPPFLWIPVQGAKNYRVIIERATGTNYETVLDQTVDTHYLIPKQSFPIGDYRWTIHSDSGSRGWQAFSINSDSLIHIPPSAKEILERLPIQSPRLMYSKDDCGAIIGAYPERVSALRRNVEIAYADGLPPRPLFHRKDSRYPEPTPYRVFFGRHRDFIDRNLIACALAYFLLDDRTAGEFAKSIILEICDWNPEGPCSPAGQWGDEIGLSHARCLPLAFDWTSDLFNPAETDYVVRTIAQYGRIIDSFLKRQNFTANPGNSHSARLPAYLGNIALIVAGRTDDNAEAWLQSAFDVYSSFFPHYGGRDGGWAEGTFYATSYVKWYLPFFLSIERISGFRFLDRPFYRNLTQFLIHFCPPGWEIHPFGDGYWCLPDSPEWPGFFAQNPFAVYADRFGPDLARQFSRQLGAPEFYNLHLPDAFPPIRPAPAFPEQPHSNSRLFNDSGFLSIQSDVEHPDENTALLVRASKYGAGSHRHADNGGFAVISKGKGLLTPSGYFGYSYGTTHHREWTQRTVAHNCLLINGEGQPRDHRATARFVSFDDAGDYAVAQAILTECYPGVKSYIREFLFIRPGLIIVLDRVDTDSPASYSWLAHTLSEPVIADNVMSVQRLPASLAMRLFHPDSDPVISVTDRFGVDLNADVPPSLHVSMPKQYHIRWDFPNAVAGRFSAVIAVNEPLPGFNSRMRNVQFTYRGFDLELDVASATVSIEKTRKS